MSVGGVRIEVTERESPAFGVTEFGIVGPYERLHGTVFGELDPEHPLPRLPGVNLPNVLNELRLRDHSVEPPSESATYPVFVQSTDADGNALGGIRHPLLAAPLATHVGWSLRASGYAEGELFTIRGSMIPLAQTEAERLRAEDPRPSLEARYASRDAWAAHVPIVFPCRRCTTREFPSAPGGAGNRWVEW